MIYQAERKTLRSPYPDTPRWRLVFEIDYPLSEIDYVSLVNRSCEKTFEFFKTDNSIVEIKSVEQDDNFLNVLFEISIYNQESKLQILEITPLIVENMKRE